MRGSESLIEIPDFTGMQALNAWLAGHDIGLLLSGPDPDCPEPLLHGVVRRQSPLPGRRLARWDVVTVWIEMPPEGGVREPRRPVPVLRTAEAGLDAAAAERGWL